MYIEERLKELTAVLTDLKSKTDEQQQWLLQLEQEKIEMNNEFCCRFKDVESRESRKRK